MFYMYSVLNTTLSKLQLFMYCVLNTMLNCTCTVYLTQCMYSVLNTMHVQCT